MTKTVTVVGATGYLGSRLSASLISNGYRVNGWGRQTPASENWLRGFNEYNTGDVTLIDTLKNVVDQKADIVLYCVSMDHIESAIDIGKTLQTNVRPVWELADFLCEAGQPVHFVYLSTAQVYGSQQSYIDEKSSPKPGNHYGLTHLMAENVLSRYAGVEGFSTTSLRLSNGYGAPIFEDANCWWLVINDFSRMAVSQGSIHLNSSGSQFRNFVHISDICQAVERIIGTPATRLTQPVYNVGGSSSISILDLAHKVAECYQALSGKSIMVTLPGGRISESVNALGAKSEFDFSIQKISELGYSPLVELETGIEEVLKYEMSRCQE